MNGMTFLLAIFGGLMIAAAVTAVVNARLRHPDRR